MFSKVKKCLKLFQPSNSSSGKDNIVTIVSRMTSNLGLLSYTTILKVNWVANISTICFLYTCLLQIIALSLARDDPERLFECFSVFSFCGMGVLKLQSLRQSHEGWRFLLSQISVTEHEQLNEPPSPVEYDSDNEQNNEEFSSHIRAYTKKFKRTSTILIRIYGMTAFIFILSPFIELSFCRLLGMECLMYPHILPGWAPLDFSIFGYIASVFFEVVAAVYCVSVHIVYDVMAIGVMVFVCGQFSLLREYSARVAGKGKICNISKKRDARARCRIIKCHRIYTMLVSSITGLDKLLRQILGVYFFVATLTLCSVAVRLKSEDMSIMQLVTLIQYMCGTLTQLFLFCSYGDAVMHQSSVSSGEGPFGAAIWCISPRTRRDIKMLGASMMRPRRLHAGPFNSLNLPSFIQIVRAAYSYYAVLGKKENQLT